MAYTKICECGKNLEALSEGQLNFMFKEHLKGKSHKKWQNGKSRTH